MDQLDKKALETAQKALSGGRFDWQAYLLLAVAEMRSEGTTEGESDSQARSVVQSGDGKFEALLADYNAGSDKAFETLLSFFESGLSELTANESGDRRKKAVEACKRLASVQ